MQNVISNWDDYFVAYRFNWNCSSLFPFSLFFLARWSTPHSCSFLPNATFRLATQKEEHACMASTLTVSFSHCLWHVSLIRKLCSSSSTDVSQGDCREECTLNACIDGVQFFLRKMECFLFSILYRNVNLSTPSSADKAKFTILCVYHVAYVRRICPDCSMHFSNENI